MGDTPVEEHRRQLKLYGLCLIVLAAATSLGVLAPTPELPGDVPAAPDLPLPALALIGAVSTLAIYGLLGVLGYTVARRLGWPGIHARSTKARTIVFLSVALGTAVGCALIAGALAFERLAGVPEAPHPPFPWSLLASLTAGFGEEVLCRLFGVSVFAGLMYLLVKSPGGRRIADWTAIVAASVVFAALHLPGAMMLAGAATPIDLGAAVLAEIVVLNVVIGLVTGWAFIRHGWIAAAGIHFWTDIVWHVIFGSL